MTPPYNPKIRAMVTFADGSTRKVKGREAQAIDALHRAGKAGINAAQMSSWALRLGHYIFKLRSYGFEILTERIKFDGGWYGQYILKTPLTSVEVFAPEKKKPAHAKRASNPNSQQTRSEGKDE